MKKLLSSFVIAGILSTQCGIVLGEIIEDEVAKQSFAGQKLTKPIYSYVTIIDDTAPSYIARPSIEIAPIEDELLVNDQKLKTCDKTRPAVHYKIIDEKNSIVKIKVSPKEYISSKNNLKTGGNLELKISRDIYRDGTLFIKKDTPVKAYIELISEPDRFGDPQEIELGRLTTKDTKDNIIEIEGVIRKEGANRAKWVKPIYYIGACAPFGAPLMVVYFIKGGKTKLKPTEEFEFYYE